MAVVAFVAACGGGGGQQITSVAPADTALAVRSTSTDFAVDTLARGLVVPWGVALAPDGRIFITERRGRILVVPATGGQPVEWARLTVHAEDASWGPESGLTGLALAPDFARSGEIFVMATVRRGGDSTAVRRSRWLRWKQRFATWRDPAAAAEFETRIVRFTERVGKGVDPTVILAGVPANHYHAGGALAFGPDSMLYAGFGDAQEIGFPRDTSVLAGKLIRVDRLGRVPRDNPIPASPIYAMGLRNPQAIAWLQDGTLIVADHGPSGLPHEGGRAGRDELNVVTPGADFGWPLASGWEQAAGLSLPLWVWREAIAPAGLAVHPEPSVGGGASVLVGALAGAIERVDLAPTADGWRAFARERLFVSTFGRIRTLTATADGAVLVTTSNRDARGNPRPDDDLLILMRPVQ